MIKKTVYLMLTAAIFGCSRDNTTNNAMEKLSNEEVQELVKKAYVHCFPLFENYKAIYFYGVAKESPKYMPMNAITNETTLYTPDDRLVVSPNNDTYYSTGILDLRAEPVIIKVPDSKSRYYVFQLVDMVTNNFAYIGVNSTGRKAGIYAITGPQFNGTLPAGVKEIKSPSQFLILAGRTAVDAANPQDMQEAQKLQKQYQVGVISKFYPEFPAQQAVASDFPVVNEGDHTNEQFFTRLNFLLPYTQLSADDQASIDKFKAIGVSPGVPYTFIEEHPAYRDAVMKGIREGIAIVDSLANNIGERINGWYLAPVRDAYFGTDYNLRTGYAKKAIYANTPAEAYYPTAAVDAEGEPLNGNNSYKITFPAKNLPPSKFFWSITMYNNADQLLVANQLKRYSIGDRTKGMKLNTDGSLTIYIGNRQPVQGTSNWLPAPPAGFNLMMRIYGPKDEVLSKTWTPPAIVKVAG